MAKEQSAESITIVNIIEAMFRSKGYKTMKIENYYHGKGISVNGVKFNVSDDRWNEGSKKKEVRVRGPNSAHRHITIELPNKVISDPTYLDDNLVYKLLAGYKQAIENDLVGVNRNLNNALSDEAKYREQIAKLQKMVKDYDSKPNF